MKAADSGLACVKRDVNGVDVTVDIRYVVERYAGGKKGGVCHSRTGDIDRKPIFSRALESPY